MHPAELGRGRGGEKLKMSIDVALKKPGCESQSGGRRVVGGNRGRKSSDFMLENWHPGSDHMTRAPLLPDCKT